LKKKKSVTITTNKSKHARNAKTSEEIEDDESSDDDDDDDDDESEPMDFDRAFGSISDASKIEHMDIYRNDGLINGLNSSEGDSYFDLSTKLDLKTYTQPVLISSTINLNSLAAVSIFIKY
jgi:hypothetical protein